MFGLWGSAAVGVTVFLLLHVILWRVFPSDLPRIRLLALLSLIGMASSIAVHLRFHSRDPIELYAVCAIDVFAMVLYTFFYAGLARSVSLTLMIRFLQSRLDSTDLEILAEEYAASTRFEDRIYLMQESGLVRVSGHSVSLTPRGKQLGFWSRALGRWLQAGLEG
jgi:hypothetical protein